MKKITIGLLAKMANVGVETVRFYQRKGLIRGPGPLNGSIRTYSEEDAQRIIFINNLRFKNVLTWTVIAKYTSVRNAAKGIRNE